MDVYRLDNAPCYLPEFPLYMNLDWRPCFIPVFNYFNLRVKRWGVGVDILFIKLFSISWPKYVLPKHLAKYQVEETIQWSQIILNYLFNLYTIQILCSFVLCTYNFNDKSAGFKNIKQKYIFVQVTPRWTKTIIYKMLYFSQIALKYIFISKKLHKFVLKKVKEF